MHINLSRYYIIVFSTRDSRSDHLARVSQCLHFRGAVAAASRRITYYYYYIYPSRAGVGRAHKKQTHSDEAAAAASVAADTRRVMTRRPVDPKESGSGARACSCVYYVFSGVRSETAGPY